MAKTLQQLALFTHETERLVWEAEIEALAAAQNSIDPEFDPYHNILQGLFLCAQQYTTSPKWYNPVLGPQRLADARAAIAQHQALQPIYEAHQKKWRVQKYSPYHQKYAYHELLKAHSAHYQQTITDAKARLSEARA